VLESVATTPQESPLPPAAPAPVVPITAARRHRRARWGAVAAAVAAVAAVVVALLVVAPWAGEDTADRTAQVLDDPNARTLELTGELAGLRLVHSAAAGASVLEGDAIPTPEGTDVYELWRIAGATPEPVVRDFRPDEDGAVSVLMEGVDPGDDTFAVTLEPSGGSDQPTSQPIAATA
jgi:hypothetical protein